MTTDKRPVIEREDEQEQEDAYRAAAVSLYHRDGEVEIDAGAEVSVSTDGGAYVQAWVWVCESDLGPEGEDAQ